MQFKLGASVSTPPPPPQPRFLPQIIASALDSVLDVISGGLLYISSRATLHLDKHKYPQGKSRSVPRNTHTKVLSTAPAVKHG